MLKFIYFSSGRWFCGFCLLPAVNHRVRGSSPRWGARQLNRDSDCYMVAVPIFLRGIKKVMGLAGSAGYFDALITEVSQVKKFSIRTFFLIL